MREKVKGIKPCLVSDCDSNVLQKGYCPKHYMKWYRYGDPLAVNIKPARGVTPTSISWTSMKQRCSNPNNPSKSLYMARGINYDPRWEYFENFLEDMGERPPGTTLDRIDNDKGYSKQNCRWATPSQQMNNTRSNRRVFFEGNSLTLSEWSRRKNISFTSLRWRLDKGWSLEDVFNKPVRKKKISRNY